MPIATTNTAMGATLKGLASAIACSVFIGHVRAAEPLAANTAPSSINSASLERALHQQLNKHVSFPLLTEGNMYGTVEVAFVVNTEGRIELLSARSENDALCDYVVRKLAKVDIGENPSGTWKTSHMRFVFRPEA